MKQIFLIGFLVLAVTACGTNYQYANKTVNIADLDDRESQIVVEYTIGIGDKLNINVWKNPDLSVTVPVRPDGKISAPLIGDILVAGFTPEEVSKFIEDKLKKFIRTPNVVVIMTNLGSTQYLSRVRVTGAVRTNLSLNYQQGMTLLDAVLAAGGPNEFADSAETRVFRRIDTETVLIPIDLDSLLKGGNLNENIILKPGDTITVPERSF
jgi:polysaccharide export outer membrane protein